MLQAAGAFQIKFRIGPETLLSDLQRCEHKLLAPWCSGWSDFVRPDEKGATITKRIPAESALWSALPPHNLPHARALLDAPIG
jgi:hypothetical protein